MQVNPIPEGYHTITPYFTVSSVSKMIAFLKAAFGAEEITCHKMADGTIMNAEVKVGTSMVMLGEARGDYEPRKFTLYMYVSDPDSVYKKAIQAGAKSIMEPTDQFYGDRSGAVEDSFGNQWWIAKRVENVSNDEIMKRAAKVKG